MSRTRDAGLAASLLAMAVAFGVLEGTSVEPPWLVAGGVATVGAEVLAYRRRALVRRWFGNPTGATVAAAIAGVAIAAGGVVAPDRSVSFAIGAIGSYLALLATVGTADRTADQRA